MPVFRLRKGVVGFPDPRLAEEDGLLAVGGDLSVDMLLLAYSNGIFPWFNKGDPVLWWCPRERFIIRPQNIHISKNMRQFMRNHDTRILLNRDFADTIHRCRVKREFNEGTRQAWKPTSTVSARADCTGYVSGAISSVRVCTRILRTVRRWR